MGNIVSGHELMSRMNLDEVFGKIVRVEGEECESKAIFPQVSLFHLSRMRRVPSLGRVRETRYG